MGNCKFCGKPAGLFRSRHKECQDRETRREVRSKALLRSIDNESITYIRNGGSAERITAALDTARGDSAVTPAELSKALLLCWSAAVDVALSDNIITDEEQDRLLSMKDMFGLQREAIESIGAWEKIVKAAVLRDVMNGTIPDRVTLSGALPINLQKGESVVWAFKDTEYLEDRTRREVVGRTAGVSVRLAKGIYYRTGAFSGTPVIRTERTKIDRGWLVATNKHIYFSGSEKSFRVPFSKIVSFQPFSDGLGIMRDAASAKAQLFITDDGWFSYNLIMNLARL